MPRMELRSLATERIRRHAVAATVVFCVAVAGWLLGSTWMGAPAQDDVVDTRTFAHWHGDGYDWLLKAEPEQGLLVIYDARDGRPLQRLPAAGVQRIVLEDDLLFVLGSASPGVRLLRLRALALQGARRPDVPSP
jgi:hypothetical protein